MNTITKPKKMYGKAAAQRKYSATLVSPAMVKCFDT